MHRFIESRRLSFQYAFQGWWYVLRTQRNAWIHTVATLAVALVALWLKLSTVEWALLVVAVSIVWMAEFVNTAIEAVVDLASQHQQHELARVSKDVGAAAVLIAALSAALIGLLVIGPPLWAKLFN